MIKLRRWAWIALLVGAGALAGIMLTQIPATASGGGGCGRPVTDARGARVAIRTFCFTPTVLHVDPGQTVTWTNRDPFAHNVMGASAAWGSFDFVKPGRSVSYRFTRAGTYPFVCTLHPGMVGAVVVGDGKGPAVARTTTVAGPVVAVRAAQVSQAGVGGRSAGAWPVATFVGYGLFATALAGIVVQRRAVRARRRQDV